MTKKTTSTTTTIKIALIYDFDGTLSPDNIQEHAFIKAIGDESGTFWEENEKFAEENSASSILCYMHKMIKKAQEKNKQSTEKGLKISLTKKAFEEFGKDVRLYDGVKEWFKLINDYGRTIGGVEIEHYINSSGLKEMIEGTSIAKEFKRIYACSFLYENNEASWPAVAVDYTAKTQFLFKINKGIDSVSDNKQVNKYMPEEDRPVPFSNMIYFGDGETDIPCMKLVKDKGGYSIAVYDESSNKKQYTAQTLIKEDRVNFACSANYSFGMELYNVVTKIIDKIKADSYLKNLQRIYREKTIVKEKTEITDPQLL